MSKAQAEKRKKPLTGKGCRNKGAVFERFVAKRAREFDLLAECGVRGAKDAKDVTIRFSNVYEGSPPERIVVAVVECRNRKGMTLVEAIRMFQRLSPGYTALAFKHRWLKGNLILVCFEPRSGIRGKRLFWMDCPNVRICDLDCYLELLGGTPPEVKA
jgi:hypothetical protein